jgi:glycosyltransferase involved in cell wall biosynthesis
MRRILFVGHDASRTGAPIILLHLLRWFRENRPDRPFDLLLLKGGEIEADYREVCDVHVMPPKRAPRGAADLVRKVRRRLGLPQRLAKNDVPDLPIRPDIVVGNTILSLPVLDHFSRGGLATVGWLHEMERLILDHYSPGQFRRLCDRVDRLIFASERAAEVKQRFAVCSPHEIIYDFAPPMDSGGEPDEVLRGIPPGAFVVLGCGTVEPRKGVHLFAEVGSELTRKFADMYFIWLGARISETDGYARHVEAAAAGNERIIFAGQRADVRAYFERADLFALTSLEDPFPMVVMQAANFAAPTVCFARGGGIPEFVRDDAGAAVPLGDAGAFADAVEQFYKDREKLKLAGETAKRKFETDFSMENSCRRIASVIDSLL